MGCTQSESGNSAGPHAGAVPGTVCARLQTITDAVFRDAVTVIDTALDVQRVEAAAAVMQACVAHDNMALADAVAKYNAAGYAPLGFVEIEPDELPEEWKIPGDVL